MNRTPFSIRAIAFFLLFLFVIGAVPKIYFHSALVHHKDIAACGFTDKSAAHIDTDGFNCDIDQQVVSLPFLAGIESLNLIAGAPCYTDVSGMPVPEIFSCSIPAGTRGPPDA
ncbi:MAG TPA: hypothetical protein VLC28_08515 [Flavitalea sp.]|nr:hypothetical protein [Flavitalea sp.]